MKGRASRLVPLVFLSALSMTACDSFSLLDQFTLPDERLTLVADKTTVERLTGTVGLTPSGGTGPYSFSVSGSELYSGTQGLNKGSVSDNTYTAGGAIGEIRITVLDSAGSSSSVNITVLPSPPTFSGTECNRTGSGDNVTLAWNYSDEFFEEYRLEFSIDNISYSNITGSNKKAESYTGNNVGNPESTYYYYRLFTIAGIYESAPAIIQLPRP